MIIVHVSIPSHNFAVLIVRSPPRCCRARSYKLCDTFDHS